MGNSVRDIDVKVGRIRSLPDYDAFQADEEGRLAILHPTALDALTETLFDRIARHGFEVAEATLSARAASTFPKPRKWVQAA
jgi:NTE family protein